MLRPSFVVIVSAASTTLACEGVETCNPPPIPVGVVIDAPRGLVTSIAVEGVCNGKMRCLPRDFGEPFVQGCERYQLLATDVGRCVVNVGLTNGETHRFETNIIAVEFCDRVTLTAEGRQAATFVVPDIDAGPVGDAAEQ